MKSEKIQCAVKMLASVDYYIHTMKYNFFVIIHHSLSGAYVSLAAFPFTLKM